MNHAKKIIMSFVIGSALMLGSLALPQTVTSYDELRNMHFGLPFWFIKQDVTAIDRTLPAQVYFSSIRENPSDFRLAGLLGSWIVLCVLVFVFIEIFVAIKKRGGSMATPQREPKSQN